MSKTINFNKKGLKFLTLYVILFFLCTSLTTNAANYYWIGGSGNWSDPTHWATTSGGATLHNQIPTAVDDVFFDANSFTAVGQTVTLDPLTILCRDLSWVGVTNNPTLAGAATNLLKVYGSLSFAVAMNMNFLGKVNFESVTTGRTILSNGKTFSWDVVFNGVGGGWTLQDSLKVDNDVVLNNGTLNTNNRAVVMQAFESSTTTTRAINMGSSIFTLNGSNTVWNVGNNGMILNCGTSVINVVNTSAYNYFEGGNKTYYDLNFTSANNIYECTVNDNNNFHDVNFAAKGAISSNNTFRNVVFNKNGTMWASNTFANLTFSPSYSYILQSGTTQTITGNFNATGNCGAFVDVSSSTAGTIATINKTTGVVNASYLILKDINAIGAATFNASSSINLGNSAGWVFTSPLPKNLYWIGNTGNWDDGNHWALTSGGAASGCSPSPIDNVFFDANSFSNTGQVVIINTPTAYCNNMSWVGATNAPSLDGAAANLLKIYGSLTFVPAVLFNYQGQVSFNATTTGKTITSAGLIFKNIVKFNGAGGVWTLQDAFTTLRDFNLQAGTLTTNNQTVNATRFYSDLSAARTLNMGSSIFNISDGSNPWNASNNNFTLNAGTSVINISGTYPLIFQGGNKIYHNVNFTNTAPAAQALISDNNTFNDVVFSSRGRIASANTFRNVTFFGSGEFLNNNTFNNLILAAGQSYILGSGRTQTINGNLTAIGNCNGLIEINASTSGTQASISKPTGNISISYVILRDIVATGGATFTANNAVNLGNNAGWVFTTPVSNNLYWIGNTGNWDDGTHWSYTSGGGPAGCAPSPTDNVFFDVNSFSITNQIVTINVPTAYCRNMTWTGVTNVPTFAGIATHFLKIFGSLTFFENMNISFLGAVNFEATTANNTISMKGKRVENVQFNGTGSWILQDSFKVNRKINLNSGTLTTNNNPVVAGSFRSVTNNIVTRTLNMGSSIFTLSDIVFFWEIRNAGFNVNAGTSTINSIGSSSVLFFNGGGKIYYDLNFINANVNNEGTIFDDNTFHNVTFNTQGRIEGSNTFNTATFRGDGTLASNNTFNTLIFSAGHSYIAFSGRTQTIVNRWQVQGSCVSYVLLESSTAGAFTTFTKAIGTVPGYNIHLKDIRTTGGATFFAYNSVNLGGNTGWVFTALPGLLPPNNIIGPTAVCASATGIVYRTTPVTGAIYYQWSVPAGATITSGQGDTIITVNFGANVVGNVSLQSFNGCNYSSTTTNLAITSLGVQLTPSVAILANPSGAVCPNLPVSFTATATNIGTAVATYNFYVNGVSMQNTSSNIYTSSTLANADIVTCIISITGGGTCFSALTATSNAITMNVNNNAGLTPTLQIVKAPAGNVCAGTTVTFTANTTNTNGTVTYNFKVNNVSVQNTLSNTYTTNTLLNSDVVSCDMVIVGGICLASTTAISNTILINLSSSATPSVQLISNPNTTICNGTSVIFTATAANINGGTVTYNFSVNGTTVQNTASNTYTNSALINGDIVRCQINILNGACLTSNTALSSDITMVVAPNLLPSVLISSNANGTVCAGVPILFTATATNTSTGILNYNFMLNGISVQNSPSNTYTSSTLVNGSVVNCSITIVGGLCLQAQSAISNDIVANISPNYSPTILLTLNTSLPICAGTNVGFTATASNTNSGAVTYTFTINGVNVQSSTSNTFTTNLLSNADVVSCSIVVSVANCLLINTANSNSINMVITPVLLPTINIMSSATNICVGAAVTYTATTTNGGTTPTFQWKINGLNVGANINSFTTNTITSADIVTCELTSNLTCVSNVNSLSNPIQINVDNTAQPSVTINANKATICKNDEVIFTASPTNVTNTVAYQWKVNGANVGDNTPVYNNSNLSSSDVINCYMTTIASCSVSPYISNNVSIIVNPKPVITFNPGNTTILFGNSIQLNASVVGNIANYIWSPTTTLINASSLSPIAKPQETTVYNLQAISTDNCKTDSSIKITVLKGIYIPNSFTPNADGVNDVFRIPATAALASVKYFSVFNRYGEQIFSTTDKNKGWDGMYKGLKAPTGAYVYIISGNDVKGEVLLKGTVLLIR
jgi:gliding motility-associated-like protein